VTVAQQLVSSNGEWASHQSFRGSLLNRCKCASGFKVERLVAETFEFVVVCVASIRRPTADDGDEDRC
jgi:hypothetical protein